MKTLTRFVVCAVLSGGASFAQSLVGTWQGTLHIAAANRDLRTVIRISTSDADSLKAVFYSIDQPGAGIPVASVTLQGTAVKFSIPAINGTYEGKLGADGNSIAGTWTQGAPLTLNLTRATNETAWVIPEPPPPPVRMAANADPAFTVATIKPSEPGRPGRLFTVRGADVLTINTTLNDLIGMAYSLHPRQLSGGPAWMETDKYDVTGRPDVPGQPDSDQMKTMIQKLLADRFQLKFHREKKELTVYAITVGKTGVKFSRSERDPNGLTGLLFGGPGAGMTFRVTNATMAQVAGTMGNALERPVVDQSGLTGKYDFVLKWTPDETQFRSFGGAPPPPPANVEAPPDLFTAIQEQLGLKLESVKAPVDVVVIDHVEKPSDN
jgi:uncharacterized protein (TIGR03435 family)